MQIDKIVADYVSKSDTDYAIMIDGEWGAGKTWYWNHVLTPIIYKIKTKDSTESNIITYQVANISLFGISSIDDLRFKIFEETNTLFKNKYTKTSLKLVGFVANKAANFFNIGETKGKDISELFSDLSVNLEHYVLCFDDLERIKPALLMDLLGYINTLIEHEKVKVVFISNEKELVDSDYVNYKEKLIRFTHSFKLEISQMVEEFSKEKTSDYSNFLVTNKDFIAAVYKKGWCSNLRTLLFNLDIFEHVFKIIAKTLISDGVQKKVVTDYMLLLSMIYSIEYRRDNNAERLRSLIGISRQWGNKLDFIESLEVNSATDFFEEPKESNQNIQSELDKLIDYQKVIKRRYFNDTCIYGSSSSLIEYLLTGYCDDDLLQENIKSIALEVKQYETSEDMTLYKTLSNIWDSDDCDMKKAVKRTIEKVRNNEFCLQDYPNFFLALQRLHKLEFIDLEMNQYQLMSLFENAISHSKSVTYIKDLNTYYSQNEGISTPEYNMLVAKVKQLNESNNQKGLLTEFQQIVLNRNSKKSLTSFSTINCNIFKNIATDEFLDVFRSLHNRRKHEYLIFFHERYKIRELYDLDKDFTESLCLIIQDYLSDSLTPISGTRKYCSELLGLLEKSKNNFVNK